MPPTRARRSPSLSPTRRASKDLGVVNTLIDNFLDGRQACCLAYSRPFNVIYFASDAGGGLSAGLEPGGSGSASNSQCTVNASSSSVSASGNTHTLGMNLSFTAAFKGNLVVYLAAGDSTGATSGWQALGTMTLQ